MARKFIFDSKTNKTSIMSNKSREITISNVPDNLKRDLDNIAANMGVPLASFLKPELTKIANSYPPEMKKPIKN